MRLEYRGSEQKPRNGALSNFRRRGYSRTLQPLMVQRTVYLQHLRSRTSSPRGLGETRTALHLSRYRPDLALPLPLGPAPYRSPSVVISCGSVGKGRRWRRWGNLCGWRGVSAAEARTKEGGGGGGVPCRNRGGGAAQAPRPGARLSLRLASVTVDVLASGSRVGACDPLDRHSDDFSVRVNSPRAERC